MKNIFKRYKLINNRINYIECQSKVTEIARNIEFADLRYMIDILDGVELNYFKKKRHLHQIYSENHIKKLVEALYI